MLNEQLHTSAILCGDYLTHHIDEHGHFDYIYHADSDRTDDEYDLIRHCGAVYGLVELFQITKDEKYLKAAEAGIDFFLPYITPVEINGVKASTLRWQDRVSLGSNGLAVLSLLKYYRVKPSDPLLSVIVSLAKWMIATQDADGQFIVNPKDYAENEFFNFNQGYYPGQAIYAFALLDSIDDTVDWKGCAAKAAHYYIHVRNTPKLMLPLQHDHWFLYGLNHLHRIAPDPIYIKYAARSAQSILAFQNNNPVDRANVGGYYSPANATQTAIRNEALFQAYQLIRDFSDETVLLESIYNSIHRANEFLSRHLIDTSAAEQFPNPTQCIGGIINVDGYNAIQIDFVQHAMTSFLAEFRLAVSRTDS